MNTIGNVVVFHFNTSMIPSWWNSLKNDLPLLNFISIDASKPEFANSLTQYQITTYPTFLLIDANGQEVFRQDSIMTQGEMVDAVLANFPEEPATTGTPSNTQVADQLETCTNCTKDNWWLWPLVALVVGLVIFLAYKYVK